jgi:hypothetical protein
MSVQRIRQSLAFTSDEKQNPIAAYLVRLHAPKLGRKVNGPDPAQWFCIEELRSPLED